MKITKYIIITVLILMLLAGLGFYFYKSGRYKDTIRPAIKKMVMPVYNLFRDVEYVESEHLIITISENDYKEIKKIRNQAIEDKMFVRGKGKYFPATIQWHDSTYNVKLRLKGDMLDHLESEKWSYRIKVLDRKKILNMASFSIQHPYTRNFIWEWLFHKGMKMEGVISLDYKFINVSINKTNYGIYAMEEGFNDHMLMKNGRDPSPVLKFDEEDSNREFIKNKKLGIINAGDIDYYFSSKIEVYRTGGMLDDSVRVKLQSQGINNLENFRNRKVKTSEVFNIQKLARYFVTAELFSTNHSLNWTNQRFYFDIKTNYFEPIAYDGDAWFPYFKNSGILHFNKGHHDSTALYNDFLTNLFSDTVFYIYYIQELNRIGDSNYVLTFLNNVKKEANVNLQILNIEFPAGAQLDENLLYQNVEKIKTIISPSKCIKAYLNNNNKLKIGNLQLLPVQIKSVTLNDLILVKCNIIIPGKQDNQPINYTSLKFDFDSLSSNQSFNKESLKIKYNILGLKNNKYEKIELVNTHGKL